MWNRWLKGLSTARAAWRPTALWQWLPSRCAICQTWPQAPICETCIGRFAQPQRRCTTCALPLPHAGPQCGACLLSPPPLDLCLTATAYAWPWVELIARYKFREQAGWDRPLATLMRSVPWAEDTLDAADWVLPIPLSSQRLSERGYNQAWLLARQLSPNKADAQLLMRTRDTPSQRHLPRAERLANLEGAFALAEGRSAQLTGKRVVLVDDVMTSGASLHSAARALRLAGAVHISALVLARTEAHGPN
jgi:ComF family protein